MNVKRLIRELNSAPSRMAYAARVAINSEARKLIVDFRRRSPVDSGEYKGRWKKSEFISSIPGVIAGTRIFNDDTKASLMEFGANPDEAPWHYPQVNANTGKLTASGGKIWAGGLRPGHHLSIGGAIDPVLFRNNERQMRIANNVGTKVAKRI